MDKKKLIDGMYAEVSEYYRSANLKELIELLLSVLLQKTSKKELSGIEERQYSAFCKIFDEETPISEIKLCLSNVSKIEPTLKKILILVDEKEYDRIHAEHLGLAQVINVLLMNPDSKKLDIDNPERYSGDQNYMEHISRSYNLRNSEAHSYENWTRKQLFVNLDSVIITCLRAIELNKVAIKRNLTAENIKNELEIDEYLKQVINQFKSRMARFVHIRGKENFSVLGSYVIERQDEDADTKRRNGTVEELRDRSMPERKMMIWGEAGLGKSTTLEYLAYIDAKRRLKDKDYNIPILFLLGIMTISTYTIKQYICDKLDVDIDLCETLLEEGRINLFLDGLNEIPSDSGNNLKTLRLREIRQMIKNYPRTFIIITNRPQENRDFNNVPIFNLMKLSSDEINDFINKNVDEKQVRELINQAIIEDKRFIRIIDTPLILSRLIEIVKYRRTIPHSEGEIIADFLNCLFLREKEEKQDERLDIKKVNYLLRMIAFESLEHKDANAGMSESEVLRYCSKSMDTYRFSYDALYALSLVVQLGIIEHKENAYVFSHQAYQDYYYAQEELAVLQS